MLSDPLLNRANCRAPVLLCIKEHPVMAFILPKIAHFLTDFHRDWFPSLNLPLSDGKQKQLLDNHFKALYQRLQTLPGGRGEVGVYRSLYVGHTSFMGNQIVHCTPSPHITASINWISSAQSRLAPSFKDSGKNLTSISTQPGTEGWSCCSRYTSEQRVVTSWSASALHYPLSTTLTLVDPPRRGGKTLQMIKPSWRTYLSCQNLSSTLPPSHTSLVAFLSSLQARLAQYHTG